MRAWRCAPISVLCVHTFSSSSSPGWEKRWELWQVLHSCSNGAHPLGPGYTRSHEPGRLRRLLLHQPRLCSVTAHRCLKTAPKSAPAAVPSLARWSCYPSDCSFIAENLNVRASSEYYTSHNQIQTFTWKCQDTSIFGHSLWCMSINSLITQCVSTLQTWSVLWTAILDFFYKT